MRMGTAAFVGRLVFRGQVNTATWRLPRDAYAECRAVFCLRQNVQLGESMD